MPVGTSPCETLDPVMPQMAARTTYVTGRVTSPAGRSSTKAAASAALNPSAWPAQDHVRAATTAA